MKHLDTIANETTHNAEIHTDTSSGLDDDEAMFDEGLGIVYEHFVRRRCLRSLVRRLNTKLALEVNYHTSVTDSVALVNMGCEIVSIDNSKHDLKAAKNLSEKASCSRLQYYLLADPRALPINSKTFDLVWNSDGITHFEDPLECIREMARVSKCFVLTFVPNRLHIGDLFFRLYLQFLRPQSKGRHGRSMTIRTLSQIFRKAELGILEQGGIDMPLWPSHLSIGRLMRKYKKGRNWSTRYFLRFLPVLVSLEEAMPSSIKVAQAHMVYVLGINSDRTSSL